jgi:hypothetical protein
MMKAQHHRVRSMREAILESLKALLGVVAVAAVTSAIISLAILILKFDIVAFMYG